MIMHLEKYKHLYLTIIKPSKYDDDGYVVRHLKGVLPSNTLACLYGLTEDVRERKVLGAKLKWHIEVIDETVQKVPVEKILSQSRRPESKSIICLAGVQSNQFPRARDLAIQLKKPGIEILIGGFHVSGTLATLPELPEDLRALSESGITLVAGEAEGRWEGLLQDALNGTLQPVYNFLNSLPDLSCAPLPRIPEQLQKRYALPYFATLDCGRGCPFGCTFCTVINVQGRAMRFRAVEPILNLIRSNYYKHKIRSYFFTDDNFARNKNWAEIFDGLIRLRQEENIKLRFMMQVDTLSYKIPDFVAKAARAGCSQVFIGLESVNPKNLDSAGKKQNRIHEFKELMQAYRDAGIATHVAYITGFPFDTEASIAQDIQFLQTELGPEQASFFMLTPLPGSQDFKKAKFEGTMLDADLNNFDSCHQTFQHGQMSESEWKRGFANAWKAFYDVKNLIPIMKKVPTHKFLDVFWNLVWYKNSLQVEGGHPMLQGFVRLKGRNMRRSDFPRESFRDYWTRRFHDVGKAIKETFLLLLELEEIWLATRPRTHLEEQVLVQLAEWKSKTQEWWKIKHPELQELYRRAAAALAKSGVPQAAHSIPSRFELWLRRSGVRLDPLAHTRAPMAQFWSGLRDDLRRGNLRLRNWIRIGFVSIQESLLFARFLFSILTDPAIQRRPQPSLAN